LKEAEKYKIDKVVGDFLNKYIGWFWKIYRFARNKYAINYSDTYDES
jgi:hypothetical protein